MEKQPTAQELQEARERARVDAEAHFARGGGDEQPGEQPFPYAAEAVQAEYARVYDETLARLRRQ